ncbi:MAG: hypothetical protein MMC23_006188 [Stictis urceolatum]|nr:hypothetical protein [Stictis urceolata]
MSAPIPPTTTANLKSIARRLLETLCNQRDFDVVRELFAPETSFTHDDLPPTKTRDEYLAMFTGLLKVMPDFHYGINDMVAELDESGKGGRVWVYARISGLPGGEVKDSVDMTRFDDSGKMVECKDVQRSIEQSTR